ncbi:MAG: D-glycerate dehydrogenase [Gemmatimonadaceae bacterium]|nr:D-glycerate dehydrogenase [Gemmatimonadaceae bacterium]
MRLPSILVTRRLPEAIESVLRDRYAAQLNTDDHQMDAVELADALRRHDIVLCTLTDRLTREVLAVPDRRARLLANFGVGTNHIDLEAARASGLAVTNTPGVLTEDTADLTMLLLLAVARRAWEGDRELRAGAWTGWRPTHLLGARVAGKTLGIVGMGRIGQAVARRARHGFAMPVSYWSRTRLQPDAESALGVTWVSTLDRLAEASDFLSLHCPATTETTHLINDAILARMPRHAFLVNTARGDVVDERALVRALVAGRLGGAALDVFDGEPHVNPALLALPNVVTLPHLGSATVESRVAMGQVAVRNITAFVQGAPLPDRVV